MDPDLSGADTLAELGQGFHGCEQMLANPGRDVLRYVLQEVGGKVVATEVRCDDLPPKTACTRCEFCGQVFDVEFRR
jgi:hypothetical protein